MVEGWSDGKLNSGRKMEVPKFRTSLSNAKIRFHEEESQKAHQVVSVSRYRSSSSMTPDLMAGSDIPSSALEASEVYVMKTDRSTFC